MTVKTSRTVDRELSTNESGRECHRVELAEVFDRLTDTDIADRNAELSSDRERNPATGRPIELGERHCGRTCRVHELARLRQRVLTRGGVDHEQGFVRSTGDLASDHTSDLLQLLHELFTCVQTSRRVDQHDVHAARQRRLEPVEYDRRRRSTGLVT